MREKITPDIATLLLTGLITDTRSFQNPNTTPRSLEVAAELLERGATDEMLFGVEGVVDRGVSREKLLR